MNSWPFSPILFQLGPLTIRWYGVMYAIAFILGYLWFCYSKAGKSLKVSKEEKDVLLISVILGVLLGGRIGYVLFYNLPYYLSEPSKIFAVWEGGMSLHGGVLGVMVALLWFRRKYKVPFLELSDLITGIAPLGLFFGRIGNFINAELYGRIATQYCIYFPTDPENCRYPSQLLQAFLEGLVLFILLWVVRRFTEKKGVVTSMFLIFYGIFRIIAEFFREPDPQIGYLWGGITEGQLLSILMILAGVILVWRICKSSNEELKMKN